MTVNNETFVRITNRDIYDAIQEVKEHVIKTNGKVKLNRYMGSTALIISLTVFGWIIAFIK